MSEYGYSFGEEKKSIVKGVLTAFSIIFPIALLLAGFIFLLLTQEAFQEEFETEVETTAGAVLPSVILNDKYKYKDQELLLKGEVILAPAVCEKKDCPESDPCCGCPQQRNLMVVDPGGRYFRETGGILRILGKNNLPYCERMVDSCDYDCPDWEIGSVYEVNGIFFAEPPPRGTALSLFFDYYFQVENARVVEGTNIGERAGRLFSAIKDLVTSSFGRDETYVLMD